MLLEKVEKYLYCAQYCSRTLRGECDCGVNRIRKRVLEAIAPNQPRR